MSLGDFVRALVLESTALRVAAAPSVWAPEKLTEAEALGEAVKEGRSLAELEELGLAEGEAEVDGESEVIEDALAEGEAEEELDPLALPLVDALVLMLPVAVPGGGGRAAGPFTPPPTLSPACPPPAPREVDEPLRDWAAALLVWEDFVAVRVEV